MRASGAGNAILTFKQAISAPYAERSALLVQINYPYIRRRRDFGKHAAFTASPVQVIASRLRPSRGIARCSIHFHSAYRVITGVSRNKDQFWLKRLS